MTCLIIKPAMSQVECEKRVLKRCSSVTGSCPQLQAITPVMIHISRTAFSCQSYTDVNRHYKRADLG